MQGKNRKDTICIVEGLEFYLTLLKWHVQGKKRKDIVYIVEGDDSYAEHAIRMKKFVTSNMRVRLGDVVYVHQFPYVKYGKHVHSLPMDDTIEGLTHGQFDAYLKHEY